MVSSLPLRTRASADSQTPHIPLATWPCKAPFRNAARPLASPSACAALSAKRASTPQDPGYPAQTGTAPRPCPPRSRPTPPAPRSPGSIGERRTLRCTCSSTSTTRTGVSPSRRRQKRASSPLAFLRSSFPSACPPCPNTSRPLTSPSHHSASPTAATTTNASRSHPASFLRMPTA